MHSKQTSSDPPYPQPIVYRINKNYTYYYIEIDRFTSVELEKTLLYVYTDFTLRQYIR